MDVWALNCWRQAQQLEERYEYTDVVLMYKKGCEIMLRWLSEDQMLFRVEEYKTKMQEIIHHAANLKCIKSALTGKTPHCETQDSETNSELGKALYDAFYYEIADSASTFVIEAQYTGNEYNNVLPVCICGKIARQRCTRCKKMWYCSKECEVNDWKSGHMHTCRPPEETTE